jgi:hypothetical protein
MTFLDPIQNQRSSNAAIAVEALASSLTFFGLLAGKGESTVETPAEASAGNPALLAIGGSNPNSGSAFGMFNGQTPFGCDSLDILVVDDMSSNRVNNDYLAFTKGQLWSEPKAKDSKTANYTNSGINQWVAETVVEENGLSQVKRIQRQGDRTPNQVALGLENDFIIHSNILAGKTIAKKENA